MATQPTHFVKYRLTDSALDQQYITFSSRKPGTPVLSAENHPLINMIAQTDEEAADTVERLIEQMTAYEQRFFAWLRDDANHMTLFMEDPISALRQAIPELPETFFNDLTSLPKLFPDRK
ncbi:hypothetical protein GWD52_11005 [Enterobacteriaceae bacterium 4M9]|nr:hypothetical protein [Enterobacteriaceae bacterium 4M9]